VNAATAARVAELEAERWRRVPRPAEARQVQRQRIREAATRPVSPADQARHRAELLAAISDTNHHGERS
jgi:hypothetical protein